MRGDVLGWGCAEMRLRGTGRVGICIERCIKGRLLDGEDLAHAAVGRQGQDVD